MGFIAVRLIYQARGAPAVGGADSSFKKKRCHDRGRGSGSATT